jgi:hypothetical protein
MVSKIISGKITFHDLSLSKIQENADWIPNPRPAKYYTRFSPTVDYNL